MNRPPRPATASLFGLRPLIISVSQGCTALGCVLATWLLAGSAGLGAEIQRTLAFITLIVANLAVILSTRSWDAGLFSAFAARNPAVPWVVGGASAFLALVVTVPVLQEIFHFALPSLGWTVAAIGLGFLTISWFEILKIIARIRRKSLL